MNTHPLVACIVCLSLGWLSAAPVLTFHQLLKNSPTYLDITQEVLLEREANVSIPVQFSGRGRIIAQKQARLTLNGPVTAPVTEVFSGFKAGNLTLNASHVPQVYPQWFGAHADGRHDDSPAIQTAIDTGASTLVLPKGNYLLNTPINVTNRPAGIILEGNGNSHQGSVLIGNTGTMVIDASGSRFTHFRNFRIVSGKENPSAIGILYARTKQTPFVEFNAVADLCISLKSDRTMNNGNGSIAIYNYAAELWRGFNIYLIADTAMVFTGYNLFNLTSPFVKIGTYPSMSVCSVNGSSTLSGLTGPCVILDNAFSMDFQNVYFTGRLAPGVKDTEYAVVTKAGGCFQQDISITGHMERKRSWLQNNVCLNGLTVVGSSAPGYPAAIVNNGDIDNATINLKTWIDVPRQDCLLISSSKGRIRNSQIILGPRQAIDAPTTIFTGNTIRTILPQEKALQRILVKPANSSFALMASDGITLLQPNSKRLPKALSKDNYLPNPMLNLPRHK